MMSSTEKTKYAYLTTAVGVALMAVTSIYGYVRALLFRPTFTQTFNSNGQFGNGYAAMHGGFRFGFTNNLTILAVLVAIVGVVWLGFAMRTRRTKKAA